MGQISAEIEEAFFERNFEYGDDTETIVANVEKALGILNSTYKKAKEIAVSIEDGECFDESETVLTFQTLSLALSNFMQFIGSLPFTMQDGYMHDLSVIIE